MSLVKCSECGKKVSSDLERCIKCGAPLKKVDEKEVLRQYVNNSKKLKKFVLKLTIIIGVLLGISCLGYYFLPNGESAYYCDEGYEFYAVGKICYDGKNQYEAKKKQLNNYLRYYSDISYQYVFDENNVDITFMGDNCYGRWSDDVKTNFCYGYNDMAMFEEFNAMNDYKNLNKVDQVNRKISGVWKDSEGVDGSKFIFYPDDDKCEVSDTGNRWKSSSCKYTVSASKIDISFEFTYPSNKSNDVSFTFNNDVTELYRDNFTYTKAEKANVRTDGTYVCTDQADSVYILKDNELNYNQACVPCSSKGYCCPSYGGTYVIDGNKLQVTLTRDYSAGKNKYLSTPKILEFTIIDENQIILEQDKCTYEWEPFPTGIVTD